jgi:hypothetical protein
LLALLLANRHNPDYDIAWPSIPRLAQEALLSVRMVQYALQSLEKKGVITIERRWKGPSQCDTNVYRFPGLASQRGGATVAPGRESSPAADCTRVVQALVHQGGAKMVAPEPSCNHYVTEKTGVFNEEEDWKRRYDALYAPDSTSLMTGRAVPN